jgi:hypothetical protein
MLAAHLGSSELLVDPAQALITSALSVTGAQDENPRKGSLELCCVIHKVVAVGAGMFLGFGLGDTCGQ